MLASALPTGAGRRVVGAPVCKDKCCCEERKSVRAGPRRAWNTSSRMPCSAGRHCDSRTVACRSANSSSSHTPLTPPASRQCHSAALHPPGAWCCGVAALPRPGRALSHHLQRALLAAPLSAWQGLPARHDQRSLLPRCALQKGGPPAEACRRGVSASMGTSLMRSTCALILTRGCAKPARRMSMLSASRLRMRSKCSRRVICGSARGAEGSCSGLGWQQQRPFSCSDSIGSTAARAL